MARARAAAVVALAAMAFMLAVTACSGDDGVVIFTTTTLTPTSSTSSIPDPDDPDGLARPKTVAEFQANLDQAAASGDICQIIAVIDLQRPDVAPGPVVVDVYRSLADTVEAGIPLAPAELVDDWAVVATTARTAVSVAERVNGDVNDPSVQATFGTPEFAASYARVIEWSKANCRS